MGRDPISSTIAEAYRNASAIRFCANVPLPEGPDAPTLSDVLGALGIETAALEMRRAKKDKGSRNIYGDVVGDSDKAILAAMKDRLKRNRTILAAFQPVEPIQETSDGH